MQAPEIQPEILPVLARLKNPLPLAVVVYRQTHGSIPQPFTPELVIP
jgi:hypothetical protein